MIGILLTIFFVIVLFGIRISINDAIRARHHARRNRTKIPKEWRGVYGRKHF
ncbi:MAG TPA: hypothetical protein VFX15_03640 [Actinomycetes bacterium]|nr:hypothetical protein [Actinomycetes bacterium]